MRVAYIIGEVRSGSTILDIVLGNSSTIQSTGELSYLLHCWTNRSRCSCGVPCDTCAFWGQVRQEWLRRTGEENAKRYLTLKWSFERVRWLPRLLGERYAPSPRFRDYAKMTRILFEAIREVSDRPIVLDSSKNPGRALALSLIPGIDLRLIHLVRDGRGVAWSRMKASTGDPSRGLQEPHPVPVWRSSLSWLITNHLAEYVSRQSTDRSVLIQYLDLVEYPRKTISQIGHLLGENLDALIDDIEHQKKLCVGHIIAGNRIRNNRYVELRVDNEWEQHLSETDQRIFWLIAGSLARKYGYIKFGHAVDPSKG